MYDVLAACYAQLGEAEEAQAAYRTYQEKRPEGYDEAVAHAAHMKMCRRQEDRDHWVEGFRKAGIAY